MGDESHSDTVEVKGDWRAFRAALVNQEHAHRQRVNQQQQQANHVVTNLTAASTAYTRRQASKITPGDWAHVLPEAETGCLLLAPDTEEGWWRHSVVLVLNHDSEGSTGVILNRPTNAQLKNVVPEIDYSAPHHRVLANRHVSMGGPMGTEKGARCLVALSHTRLDGATSEVFPGLWHVSDFSAVKPEHEPSLMVFVGYCGWMSGQLNAEVAAGGWTVAAASAANTLALVNASARAGDVMGESMWATMRGRLGYPTPGNLGYDTPPQFGAEGPL
jgi:putative transcriptional regulator